MDMIMFCETCGKVNFLKKEKIPEGASRTRCIHCGAEMRFEGMAESDMGVEEERETAKIGKPHRAVGAYPRTETLAFRLFTPFVLLTLSLAVSIAYAYYWAVPAIVEDQINQRAVSISRAFGAAVAQPLLLKNYLAVSQAASAHADLPGIAYVAVQNREDVIITGVFGLLSRFDEEFSKGVMAGGFPPGLVQMNPLGGTDTLSARNILVGSRRVHDVAVRVRGGLGTVHVGLFMEDAEAAVRRSFRPLWVVLSVLFAVGGGVLWWISAGIARPIRKLTRVAQNIALGELDLPVRVLGKGEVAELARAVENMRVSVRSAIFRLRDRQTSGKSQGIRGGGF